MTIMTQERAQILLLESMPLERTTRNVAGLPKKYVIVEFKSRVLYTACELPKALLIMSEDYIQPFHPVLWA